MGASTQRHLAANPLCCFCGGQEPATTVDHQPARIMFPDKHRPKGMEFSACSFCNKQTSSDEALVAFFARVTGNHRFPSGRLDKGLKNSIIAVGRAFPNLLREIVSPLYVHDRGMLIPRLSVNGNHASVVRSACLVAAKLGLAAFYSHYGKAAPETALINTMWTHNQNQNTRLSVDNIIRAMPSAKWLKAGSWSTEDSFFLRYHVENGALMMVAILHESLALIAQITDGKPTLGWKAWHHVWSPRRGMGIVAVDQKPPVIFLP